MSEKPEATQAPPPLLLVTLERVDSSIALAHRECHVWWRDAWWRVTAPEPPAAAPQVTALLAALAKYHQMILATVEHCRQEDGDGPTPYWEDAIANAECLLKGGDTDACNQSTICRDVTGGGLRIRPESNTQPATAPAPSSAICTHQVNVGETCRICVPPELINKLKQASAPSSGGIRQWAFEIPGPYKVVLLDKAEAVERERDQACKSLQERADDCWKLRQELEQARADRDLLLQRLGELEDTP